MLEKEISTVIVDERNIVKKPKSKKNYVNGPDFHKAISDYYKLCEQSIEPPQVPRYLGECIIFIAKGLASKINFSSYSFNAELQGDAIEKMIEAIIYRKYDPSMNKNPVGYFSQISWNCLSGETLVTTLEYGIVPIQNVAGQSVHVVDGNGNWILSECKSYGQQYIFDIEISSSVKGKSEIISTTSNHDWYLESKEKKKTIDLKKGDVLLVGSPPSRPNIDELSLDYKKGIIHGIVYGDGQASYKRNKILKEKICDGFAIRLCGKSIELKKYFEAMNYPCSYPKSYEGEPIYFLRDGVIDLKSLPIEDWYNINYLTGFIRGWMAADGNVSKTSRVTIASNEAGLKWLLSFGPRCGFSVTNSYKMSDETNFGVRKNTTYNISLDRRWLNKNDFLLEYKKELFDEFIQDNKRRFGRILDVKNSYEKKEVFCFNVPTTHSFMLTRNLLTGNCFLQRIALEKKEMYKKHKNFENMFFNHGEEIEDLFSNEEHKRIIDEFEKPKEKSSGYAKHSNLSYEKNRTKKKKIEGIVNE